MQEIKIIYTNLAGGLMVSLFFSSVINYEFESRSGQTKDYKIDINYCTSIKQAVLRN